MKEVYRTMNWLIKNLHSARLLLLMILSIAVSFTVQAQERTISGTVSDAEDGGGVPGATVMVKGTTKGTITDFDGKFQLSISDADQILVVSFVGYTTAEVEIGLRAVVDVALAVDITSLEEVVVVGYGTQRKKVVTAATVQVDGEALQKRNTTQPLQALQGQAAGVSIRSNSGQPGEGLRVNIRGLGTIGNSGPLYIVDGIATGDISFLNNADIQSIDVLKDAASAAIYGSRAANGVVLITTKKGQQGRQQITFDSYYGVQNRYKGVEMLNAKQYAQIINEQHLNSGGSISGLPFDVENLPAYNGGTNADTKWIDQMFVDNATTQNYTVGMNGGTDKSAYGVSFSYTGQEGIVGGKSLSNFERYNARITLDNSYFDGKLKVGENFTYTYTKKNGISVGNQYSNSLRSAFNTSPLRPVYNRYGQFFNAADTIKDQFGDDYWNETESNPYGNMVLNNQNMGFGQKLFGNAYIEFKPFKNLSINSSIGLEFNSSDYRSFSPEYELSIYDVRTFNNVYQNMSRNKAIQYDNYASYTINQGVHSFSGMIGMSARHYQGSYVSASNSSLVFSDFDRAWLTNALNQEYNLLSISGDGNGEDVLLSAFGRITYDYDERFMFNAIIRADGSSKFAPGYQWGYFPSVSAGWNVSEEQFLKSSSLIDYMKVRASWGQNGNNSIPSFQFLSPITFTQATYNFGDLEAINTPGAYQSRLAYEKLKWETSEQLDFGVDMRVWSNQVRISLDWYKKSTIDWLIQAPVLATAGADAPIINGGRVQNTGLEFELGLEKKFGDLNLSFSANGSYNRNEVKEIPTADERILKGENQLYANAPAFYMAEAGRPIGYFWGYETDGLFQNTSEVNSYVTESGKKIQPNAKPGDVRFVDQNGDGTLNDLDKVQLGNPNPPLTLGFTVGGSYKAWDFSVMTFGAFGHQLVQSYRDHTSKYANYTTEILDRWTGEGTSTTVPRVTNGNVNYVLFSDLFVKDGDYFRIGNLTIGYDLTKQVKIKGINQLRIYGAVNNLYTFTKYTGMDPDVGYGFSNGPQDSFSSGIDLGFYPNPRTILVGLNVKF